MRFRQWFPILMLATSYSCGKPIASEVETESEKTEKESHLKEIADDRALVLESILDRENQIVSTLKDISSHLGTFTATVHPSTPELDWRDMFPRTFSEFFEIFALLIHKRWHHELIETIEEVGEKVEETENKLEKILEQPRQRQSIQGSSVNLMRQLASSRRE